MTVNRRQLAGHVFAECRAAHLGVGEKEALIAGQALYDRCRPMPQLIILIRGLGGLKSSKVSDVLSERQSAVDMHPWHGLVGVILVFEGGDATAEIGS